jgi:1,4-dihydroxy-2-naphthoate octaprenyltransferase
LQEKARMSMQAPTVSRQQAWVMAARPKTLPAAISPVIAGTALAAGDGHFVLLPALAALMGALLLQIGSNLANDYFDAINGADTHQRIGPVRVTASGLISHASMRLGMVVVFGLAALIGLYLIWVGGWPILVTGIAAILAALAYTGGPKPFGYLGLGDLFVFLFFGPVALCGTYYVQAQRVTVEALLASIAVGALITAILVVNNLRDIKSDKAAGKYTLAVRLGVQATRLEYLILLAIAYAVAILLAITSASTWLLAPLITLPRAMQLYATIRRAGDGPTLNAALAGTAQLSLLFALCLAAGFLL